MIGLDWAGLSSTRVFRKIWPGSLWFQLLLGPLNDELHSQSLQTEHAMHWPKKKMNMQCTTHFFLLNMLFYSGTVGARNMNMLVVLHFNGWLYISQFIEYLRICYYTSKPNQPMYYSLLRILQFKKVNKNFMKKGDAWRFKQFEVVNNLKWPSFVGMWRSRVLTLSHLSTAHSLTHNREQINLWLHLTKW